MEIVVPEAFRHLYEQSDDRPIVKIPDPVLRQKAKAITRVGNRHRLLGDNMVRLMRKAYGVGLAGPQVGVLERIIVIAPDGRPNILINPEIVKSEGTMIGEEGCLSIPGLAADVDRPTYVLLKAQDRSGKEIRIKAYDWLARIFLHEIDHLHGVLMTDKATQIYKLAKNSDGEVEAVPLEQAPNLRPARYAIASPTASTTA